MAQTAYDLVLMDMQMPVMDGATATRLLRQRGCSTPVMALTANAMKGFERELEEAGFSGYQTKPIDRDALLQALAGWLGGEAVAAPPALLAVAAAAPAQPAAAVPAAAPAAITAATTAATTAAAAAASTEALAPLVSRLASHPRLARIVAGFVRELDPHLDQMQAALAAADMAELAAQAHWLKGSGGSMGFDDFFEPSKALEDAAKAADLVAARAQFEILQTLAQRVRLGAPVAPAQQEVATA